MKSIEKLKKGFTLMISNRKSFGFTLIELLVVIAIIGILIGLSAVAYSSAKVSSRNTTRKGDLESVRSALEIYRTDCGRYPASITFGGVLTGLESVCSSNIYHKKVPQDPTSGTYAYKYVSDGTTYTLCAYLEQGSGTVAGCGGNCGDSACNYKTESP